MTRVADKIARSKAGKHAQEGLGGEPGKKGQGRAVRLV